VDNEKTRCFLCGEEIEVKNSKKGKPYFICDPCGLQAFVRRERGIERLKAWVGEKGNVLKDCPGNELLKLARQMEALEAKRREMETQKCLIPAKDSKFVKGAFSRGIKEIKRRMRKVLNAKSE
jgi:hypothetical protein